MHHEVTDIWRMLSHSSYMYIEFQGSLRSWENDKCQKNESDMPHDTRIYISKHLYILYIYNLYPPLFPHPYIKLEIKII